MFQTKAQDKNPEEVSDEETGNLPEFSYDSKVDQRSWEENG